MILEKLDNVYPDINIAQFLHIEIPHTPHKYILSL